jgi:tetratricopeptide (TPR) repeat protein
MKAEHRHELKTNALADTMGRALQALKTGPSRHSLLILIVVVVAAALIGTGYFIWKQHRETQSDLWAQVDDAERRLDHATDAKDVEDALKNMKDIADKNAGTPQARALQADRARALFHRGLERLYSLDRDQAIKNIEDAREAYRGLAADKDADPVLVQEAMMGVAKADESLGNLDKALEGYKSLAGKYPNSALGKAAKERADYLDDGGNRERLKALYDKLDKQVKPDLLPTESPDKK